jgi:hypothetical protein
MFGREPVLWLAAVRAAVVGAAAFGLALTVEQTAAIYVAAEAVLSLIARQKVSPIARDA